MNVFGEPAAAVPTLGVLAFLFVLAMAGWWVLFWISIVICFFLIVGNL